MSDVVKAIAVSLDHVYNGDSKGSHPSHCLHMNGVGVPILDHVFAVPVLLSRKSLWMSSTCGTTSKELKTHSPSLHALLSFLFSPLFSSLKRNIFRWGATKRKTAWIFDVTQHPKGSSALAGNNDDCFLLLLWLIFDASCLPGLTSCNSKSTWVSSPQVALGVTSAGGFSLRPSLTGSMYHQRNSFHVLVLQNSHTSRTHGSSSCRKRYKPIHKPINHSCFSFVC
jgi:hypothetical protein